MDRKQAEALYKKYLAGEATPDERALIESAHYRWVKNQQTPGYDRDEVRASIQAKIAGEKPGLFPAISRRPRVRKLAWLPYAAAVLIAATVGIWLFFANPFHTPTTFDAAEIAPGGNRATLTLADGKVIDLSETQTGIVIGEQDITYSDGASLGLSLRQLADRGRLDAIEELVLSTPKGGTYQVTLPDGSKVWLNSASSLTYPSRFEGDERIVELVGEAYFDVAKAKKQKSKNAQKQAWPFWVVSKGQRVEVLGTQFNIAAYPDEAETKTTLVEGRVQVALSPFGGGRDGQRVGRGRTTILAPGEQAINTGQQLTKQEVDLYTVTAWQQGDFRFAEDLESIMKQVARWYDIEVSFKDESLKQESVLAYVKRNRPLSEILTILQESTGAKFAVRLSDQGKEVVIMR